MEDLHHKTIQKNYGYLLDNLELPLVLDIFISEEIIQIQEKDVIQSARTKRDNISEFISLITRRPKAYDVLINALSRTSQDFIANKLNDTYKEISGQNSCTESDSAGYYFYLFTFFLFDF